MIPEIIKAARLVKVAKDNVEVVKNGVEFVKEGAKTVQKLRLEDCPLAKALKETKPAQTLTEIANKGKDMAEAMRKPRFEDCQLAKALIKEEKPVQSEIDRFDKLVTKNEGAAKDETKKVDNIPKDKHEDVVTTENVNADLSIDEELVEDALEDGVYEETGESRTLIPRTGGEWDGEAGNSIWRPDPKEIPADKHGTNPEGKSWEEILNKYGIDGIPFKEGEPDFSEISKGIVEIDDFSEDRDTNFAQADEKLAEKKGCTPEEVREWRKENGYTWHECKDCKTMQKVPTEVHGNVPHSGGISEIKKEQ